MLRRHVPFSNRCAILTCLACVLLAPCVSAQSDPASMQAYLHARIEASPADGSAWRLLGAHSLQQGDLADARYALERALSLDPTSAATRFNLGQCYLQLDLTDEAAQHLGTVVLLAPDSDYARQAADILSQIPTSPRFLQVDYEIKRLDGSELANETTESAQRADEPSALFVKIDLGATYNSNVTLTPISRDFTAQQRESAQGFVNPFIEYRWINNDFWSVGSSFTGYFSVNENDAFSSLNLQSYQPGVFAERTICRPTTILVPKLQYDYTLDQFDGVTFGNRHAATASMTSLWDRGDTSVLYWATNYTNFSDDGTTPESTSRDGWTHATGLSHSWPISGRFLSSLTLGGDLEWAAVQGTDFAYFGGTLFAAVEVPLTDTVWCEFEAGWGMRDYYDSTVAPSRNETIWRASAKLTKQFNHRWSLSGVYNFDAFDSDNALFEADRTIAGMVTSFTY